MKKFKVIGLMAVSSLVTAVLIVVLAGPILTKAANSDLVNQVLGKILIRVENNGEAWYVNPDDGQRYYMGRPQDAFDLMKSLGLGITDADLFEIPVAPGYYDEVSALGGYTGTDYSLQYPNNFTTDTNVSNVLIITAQSGIEFMQIQVLKNLGTAPEPSSYAPNGGTYQGDVIIDGMTAEKYYTTNPIGEGAVLNLPNTHYVIDMGGEHWIQIQYYGNNSISNVFEEIIATIDIK